MEVIDFAREQLLSDLAELEQSRKDGGFNEDRLKLKLAGILSNYEIKRDTNQVFDSDIQEKANVYLAAKRIEGLSEKTLKGYKKLHNYIQEIELIFGLFFLCIFKEW